jgi:hypothetical protein
MWKYLLVASWLSIGAARADGIGPPPPPPLSPARPPLVEHCFMDDAPWVILNIRAAPNGPVIAGITNTAIVEVLDRQLAWDGYEWDLVSIPGGPPLGWAFRLYLTCQLLPAPPVVPAPVAVVPAPAAVIPAPAAVIPAPVAVVPAPVTVVR